MMDKTGFSIRFAREDECGIILEFVRKIAQYEKLASQVESTEADLHKAIFVDKLCNVIFGVEDKNIVAFALYFYNFSTFTGKRGLYLEDLYVDEKYRKKGYGTMMIRHLMALAKRQECGRMEWTCLDWNQKAIDFYLSLGARPLDEWTIFRMDGKDL